MEEIFNEIRVRRNSQDEMWGEQNHDNFTWLTILSEEVGEVAQAALHDVFGGHAQGTLYDEIIDVAAVSIAWLQCIKRRKCEKHPHPYNSPVLGTAEGEGKD